MEILYPNDWAEVGACPELIIYEPRIYKKLNFEVVIINSDNFETTIRSTYVESRSRGGFCRSIKFINMVEPGEYAIQITENAFEKVVATLGIKIIPGVVNIDLSQAINSIYFFYTNTRSVRFISNGVGKSGTSWLYHIIGSLPGITCIDMAAASLTGGASTELYKVPYSNVYHGHLGYALGNITTLEELDYHHLHIYRDLRDMVVSEYFHKFHFQPQNFRPDLVHINMQDMLTLDMVYKWSGIVYSCNSAVGWFKSNSCVSISYEDLITLPEKTLSSLLDNLGLPCHINLIRYVLKMNTFEAHSGGRKPGEIDTSSFFRNGMVGDWCNYMSQETAIGLKTRNPEYFETLGYV